MFPLTTVHYGNRLQFPFHFFSSSYFVGDMMEGIEDVGRWAIGIGLGMGMEASEKWGATTEEMLDVSFHFNGF